MQTPTIGRIVHVSSGGSRKPAVITHVWSDTCVNVTLLHNGEHRSSVVFGRRIHTS